VLFDILKLKAKALDMMILILSNNKSIVKSEQLDCLDTLIKLFKLAKNDKNLFLVIVKKMKTIVLLLLKNQIALSSETEKRQALLKFTIDVIK
jgi:hypothetical protein